MKLEGTLVSVKEILGYMAQDRYLGKREAGSGRIFTTRSLNTSA